MSTSVERKAYTAQARVVNKKPTWRDVFLPGLDSPIPIGFHPAVADVYGIPEEAYEETAATYDYLVGVVSGCLTGVLSGMLEARGISTGQGRLVADGTGKTEWRDRVLRVTAIHVHYTLDADDEVDEDVIHRVHDKHVGKCSMAQSVSGAIEVTTSYEVA